MVKWFTHQRFDVVDTFTFRLAYCTLAISPFIEFVAAAWLEHRVASMIAYGLVLIWMLGLFAILARRQHLDNQAFKTSWEDEDG